MTPAMPAAPAAPAVSAPAPAPVSAPAIETYHEPSSVPVSMENEMDALIAGNPIPAEDIIADPVTGDALPEMAPPEGDPPPPAEAPPVEAAPPAAEVTDPNAPPVPGIPEGVRLRTIDGKKAWVVEPAAGEAAFARAALVNEAETIMGEPLTKEALEFRQGVVKHWEGMRSDILSDNPADQTKFVDGVANVIRAASDAGEIGHDALSSIVKLTIDSALTDGNQLSEPILAHIASNPKVLNGIIRNLYERALNEADPAQADALWKSVQWIDKLSNAGQLRPLKEFEYLRTGGYKTLPNHAPAAGTPKPAAAAAPPVPAAGAPNPAFAEWSSKTNGNIHQEAVLNPVEQLLKTVVAPDQQKQYPTNFKTLQGQLSSAVEERLKSDPSLREQRETIIKRARMAVSPQVRNQLQTELVRQHASAAKRILNEVKGPILTEYAQLLNAQSKAEVARATASTTAGRQAATAGGPPASRSATPPARTGFYKNNAEFEKEFAEMLP